MVYFAVGALVSKVLLESGRYYSGGVLESKETTLWIVIVAGIFFCVGELGTGLFPLLRSLKLLIECNTLVYEF